MKATRAQAPRSRPRTETKPHVEPAKTAKTAKTEAPKEKPAPRDDVDAAPAPPVPRNNPELAERREREVGSATYLRHRLATRSLDGPREPEGSRVATRAPRSRPFSVAAPGRTANEEPGVPRGARARAAVSGPNPVDGPPPGVARAAGAAGANQVAGAPPAGGASAPGTHQVAGAPPAGGASAPGTNQVAGAPPTAPAATPPVEPITFDDSRAIPPNVTGGDFMEAVRAKATEGGPVYLSASSIENSPIPRDDDDNAAPLHPDNPHRLENYPPGTYVVREQTGAVSRVVVDDQHRITSAESVIPRNWRSERSSLDLSSWRRSNDMLRAEAIPGDDNIIAGNAAFDDAGHLFRDKHGYGSHPLNLIAQDAGYNESPQGETWRAWENDVQAWMEDPANAGKDLRVKVELDYNDPLSPNRPSGLRTQVTAESADGAASVDDLNREIANPRISQQTLVARGLDGRIAAADVESLRAGESAAGLRPTYDPIPRGAGGIRVQPATLHNTSWRLESEGWKDRVGQALPEGTAITLRQVEGDDRKDQLFLDVDASLHQSGRVLTVPSEISEFVKDTGVAVRFDNGVVLAPDGTKVSRYDGKRDSDGNLLPSSAYSDFDQATELVDTDRPFSEALGPVVPSPSQPGPSADGSAPTGSTGSSADRGGGGSGGSSVTGGGSTLIDGVEIDEQDSGPSEQVGTSASGSASAGPAHAGGEANASAGASAGVTANGDRTGAGAGASADANAEGSVGVGPVSASGGAGAQASAGAQAGVDHDVDLQNGNANVGAEVDGGANVSATVGGGVAIGNTEVGGEIGVGAGAEVEGEARVILDGGIPGVTVSGGADLGVAIGASGTAGNDVGTVTAEAGVIAGLAAGGGASFGMQEDGKFHVELNVRLAVGVGGEIGLDIAIDPDRLKERLEDLDPTEWGPEVARFAGEALQGAGLLTKEAIGAIDDAVIEPLAEGMGEVGDFFRDNFDWAKDAWNKFTDGAKDVVDTVGDVADTAIDGIGSAFGAVGNALGNAFSSSGNNYDPSSNPRDPRYESPRDPPKYDNPSWNGRTRGR